MKIIDLLNKIANGEEVPEKIKYRNKTFIFDKDNLCYVVGNYNEYGDLLVWLSNNKGTDLNYEVEIIEEDEKIEKYDTGLTNGRFTKDSIKSSMEYENMSLEEIVIEIAKELTTLKEKVFEIIDKINEEQI